MPTANGYVPNAHMDLDVGSNLTADAYFTTAETITFDGVIEKIEPVTNPAIPYATQHVADGQINVVGQQDDVVPVYRITAVDDYSLGQSGEFGTDNLTFVGAMRHIKENNLVVDGIKLYPAGKATGRIGTVLSGNIRVTNVTDVMMDANNKTTQGKVNVVVVCNTRNYAVEA